MVLAAAAMVVKWFCLASVLLPWLDEVYVTSAERDPPCMIVVIAARRLREIAGLVPESSRQIPRQHTGLWVRAYRRLLPADVFFGACSPVKTRTIKQYVAVELVPGEARWQRRSQPSVSREDGGNNEISRV
jgi:hypothetical protein